MPSPSMQRAEQDMAAVPPNAAPIVEQTSTDEYRPVPAKNLNSPAAGVQDVGRQPVADVTLDYDPNFQKIIKAANDPTPQGKLELVSQVSKRIDEGDKEHHNERFQPGAFLVGLLRGRVDDMYTAYNGGKTFAEKGRDALGNVVWVQKNQRGFNGRMENDKNQELSPEEVRKINTERGGVLTASDRDALQTANWDTAKAAYQAVANGDTSQLNAARTALMAAHNTAKQMNPLIEDSIYLAAKLKPALDKFSELDPATRQKIYQYVSSYNNIAKGVQTAGQKSGAVSTNANQQYGGNLGPIGGAAPALGAGGVGVPPVGAHVNVGAGQNVSQSEQNSQNINNNNSLQQMANIQSQINAVMQGALSDPKAFQDFAKLTALSEVTNSAVDNTPAEFLPRGWKPIAKIDLGTGGADSVIEQLYTHQANNGLIAAYQDEVYKSQREALKTGKTVPLEEVATRFEKSDLSKGLVNYGLQRIHEFTGRGTPLKKGDKFYNPKTGKVENYGE